MPIAATSSALIPETSREETGFFRRILAALVNARVAEAERVVNQLMERRGFHLADGEWTDGTQAVGAQPEATRREPRERPHLGSLAA